jgi:hypothetical protein
VWWRVLEFIDEHVSSESEKEEDVPIEFPREPSLLSSQ